MRCQMRTLYLTLVSCVTLTGCAKRSANQVLALVADSAVMSICALKPSEAVGKFRVSAKYRGTFEGALICDEKCPGVIYDWDFPNLGIKEPTIDEFFWGHIKKKWDTEMVEYVVTFEATIQPANSPNEEFSGRFYVKKIIDYSEKH